MGSLAAVDNDVFGPTAALQHAHLGVVSAAAEEAGGLDAEVGDALLVVVHEAEAVLLQDPLVLLFDFLQHRDAWFTVRGDPLATEFRGAKNNGLLGEEGL